MCESTRVTILRGNRIAHSILNRYLIRKQLRRVTSAGFPVCQNGHVVNLLKCFRSISRDDQRRTRLRAIDLVSTRAKLLGFQNLLLIKRSCVRTCQQCKASCIYIMLRIPRCRRIFQSCNSRITKGLLRTVASRLLALRSLGNSLTRLDNYHFFCVARRDLSQSFHGALLNLAGTVRDLASVNNCDYALCLRCTVIRNSRNQSFSRVVRLLERHLGSTRRRHCNRTICVNSHLIFSGRGFSGLSRRMSVVSPSACRLICIGRCVRGDCNFSSTCD